AVESSVPVTFGMFSSRRAPNYWRRYFETAEQTAAAGGRMFIQVHSRSLNVLLSFETNMPFDRIPAWRELRKLPLATHERSDESARGVGAEARSANYKWIFPLDRPTPPYRSIAEIADAEKKDPV